MLRKAFAWLLLLLVLAVAGLGGAAWYVWTEGDAYARQELERRLRQIGPECDLQIGKVRFDWDRQLHVYDFAVRPRGKDVPPTFLAPEAVLQIDRELFLNEQRVDVQMIRLVRPTLDLTRRLDGTWSLKDLMPFELDPTVAVPEWQIEDATIRFRLEQPVGRPIVLTLQDADLKLVPAGRRQLLIRGLTDIARGGPLQVDGRVDLDRGTWSLEGTAQGLDTAGDLAGFVLGSSPELRHQVAALRSQLREAEHTLLADDQPPPATPFRTVTREREIPPADVSAGTAETSATPRDLTGLGVHATLDLSFAFAKQDGDERPRYRVDMKCRDGQIVNPLLPFALQHLRGDLHWNNESLKLASFQADGSGTRLKLDGEFDLQGATPTGHIVLAATDLAITDEFDDGPLHAPLGKFFEVVRPSGRIDVSGRFVRDETGDWSARDFLLTAKGVAVTPEPFPVPVRDIVGSVRQVAEGQFDAAMTGQIGTRPVRLVAKVRAATGGSEVGIKINADAVAIDDTIREACSDATREVLTAIGLEGNADFEVHLYRPPGAGHDYAWSFDAHVNDGALEYDRFRYRLSHLSGDVSYNSESRQLRFRNAVAQHGRSIVRGEGAYTPPPRLQADGTSPTGMRPGLTMKLTGELVRLNDDLRAALPTSLQQLWAELDLAGMADLAVNVAWVPGTEPRIEIPRIRLTDGSLQGRAFPYLLHTIEATAGYVPGSTDAGDPQAVPGRVFIEDFVGWHDGGVRVAAKESTLLLLPDDRWEIDCPQLDVEDLTLDAELRRAVPEGLRRAIAILDPQGSIDVTGRLRLQGARSPRAPVTAEWQLTGTLVDAMARPGIEVTHATGTIRCAGRYDGRDAALTGQVDLDRAQVLGQWIEAVRGPFSLRDGKIEIGSAKVVAESRGADAPPGVPIEDRMTATYLDPGLLTLDAVVALEETPTYRGRATISGGSLERYTQAKPGAAQRNLAGVMNGWVAFQGQGTSPAGVFGRGQLRINPAQLYELPVVMQMFNTLYPVPPDNTAFRSANLDFTIRNSAFVFERGGDGWPIVLSGESLRLIGEGRVGFDGTMALELITTLPQNPVKAVSSVPLIGPLVGQVLGGVVDAATTGWVSIVVEGTTDRPSVRTLPLKVLPDGVRAVFDSITPQRAGARTPLLPGRR